MYAAYAKSQDAQDPLSGLGLGEQPEPDVPDGWALVDVKAASLNHHDLWSLKGVGLPAERLPMILGCDAAGVDQDGNDVILHAVISSPGWTGDETLDPRRSLLSERYPGTFAEKIAVPRANLVPKPAALSFEEAACLPTAWLTAYRMLFVQSGLRPGGRVLIQGAGGGVASALIVLAKAGGFHVTTTSRDEAKLERARSLGADEAVPSGARLPERVDAVMETVGAATWSHSLRSLRPGGTVVICGATSGADPDLTELNRIFFLQLRIQGSTMGTRQELAALSSFLELTGVRPLVDSTMPLDQAAAGFEAMERGDVFGKVVFTV
jgi:NADPH:quinone reductase-like Zn-dependent oxidoreductase